MIDIQPGTKVVSILLFRFFPVVEVHSCCQGSFLPSTLSLVDNLSSVADALSRRRLFCRRRSCCRMPFPLSSAFLLLTLSFVNDAPLCYRICLLRLKCSFLINTFSNRWYCRRHSLLLTFLLVLHTLFCCWLSFFCRRISLYH
jgi:hypothetical protein